tara:strand:+ start:15863 stop:17131 length:1269 start_codon:yes stop_codon:yes gene_type:complete
MWASFRFIGTAIVLLVGSGFPDSQADEWTTWRGSNGDNHAAEGTRIPLRWDVETGQNILWKSKVPGRGHSTPVVIDEGIFLTTSEESTQTQSVLKIDSDSGKVVDRWVIHQGTLPDRIHPNNSHASATMAFDGEHLFAVFHTDDSIAVTALTTDGRILWQQRVCEFVPSRFQFGFGASPLIEDGLVIVAAEYDGPDSGLYALDARNGKQVWKVKRPSNLNFATPIAATIAGQRQVLLAGAEMVTAYDPQTGRSLWKVDASTEAICSTVVWDGRRVITSGGNPASGTWCVSGDGTEKLLWQNQYKCYEQSLLAIPNYVFAVTDNGVAFCWRTSDGKEMWKSRLFGGGISASPLLVGDRIYIASEAANVFVVSATPDRFDLLAENPSGNSLFATPVAVNDRLYLRTAIGTGNERQEYLVAIGSQ